MSKWHSLPPEILNNIFCYFEKENNIKNLAQFALTCRGWKTSAQTKIFSNFNMRYDIEHLEKARQIVSKNNSLGKWVKSLDLRFGGVDTYDESILQAIDTIFPFLENIYIFAFFSEQNFQDLIFSCLFKMISETGGFSHLKKLPLPKNEYQEDLYLKSLWFLKHRITHLRLSERGSRNYHENFLEKLKYFPNMKEIEFDSEIDRRKREPQGIAEYIESLTTNSVSSLLKLSFSLSVPGTISFSTAKLKTMLPAYNLKRVEVNITIDGNDVSLPNDDFILYIMKIAPNLNFFNIKIENQSSFDVFGGYFPDPKNFDNSTLPSVKVIAQFFNYLYKISLFCSIRNFIMTSENMAKVIQSIFASCTETSSTTARKLLHNIDIRFDDPEDHDLVEEIDNTDPLKAFINYNGYPNHRTIEVVFNKYNATYRQQILEIIEQTGNYLGTMIIRLPLTCDALPVIKRLARCCTKIRGLEINCDYYPYDESDEEENDTTIIPTHNLNLHHLIFSGCVPPENQFRCILGHFPRLKFLIIDDFFAPAFEQEHVDTFFLFDMPHASLQNFKIGLDTRYLKDTIINSIYIKLTTSGNQNTRYYFMVNQKKSNFEKFKLFKNPTETKYQKSIDTEDIFNLEIRCKSLKSFQVKVAPLITHTFFKTVKKNRTNNIAS